MFFYIVQFLELYGKPLEIVHDSLFVLHFRDALAIEFNHNNNFENMYHSISVFKSRTADSIVFSHVASGGA